MTAPRQAVSIPHDAFTAPRGSEPITAREAVSMIDIESSQSLLTYARFPSASMATSYAPSPTATVDVARVCVSTTDTVCASWLTTYTSAPFGVMYSFVKIFSMSAMG